jgi:hypothetical protein
MQPADEKRMPLVSFMARAALSWPGMHSLLDIDAASNAQTQEALVVSRLLTSDSLLHHRGLYLHLQQHLKDVQVSVCVCERVSTWWLGLGRSKGAGR